jgi:steroid delta-isomerase-like uncharacterized protein
MTAPDPIDADELSAFARRYREACNSRDAATVGEFATDDVIWEDPAIPEPARGRDEVVSFVSASYVAFPDLEFSEEGPPAVAQDGVSSYFPWRMRGTNTGPIDPPGFAATGRSVDIYGIDWWQFKDGLIWRYKAVYDFAELGRQLGLMPATGSRIERIGVRLQHVRARVGR